MTVINRKDVRKALAGYLSTYLNSAQVVYAYQVSDFRPAKSKQAQSPVVYITSGGSGREKLTPRGFTSQFLLNVHTFVLHPSEDTGSGYTKENAEDILDDLEREVADAVLAIKNHELIKAIAYVSESDANDVVEIGGEAFLHEIIPLQITCYG